LLVDLQNQINDPSDLVKPVEYLDWRSEIEHDKDQNPYGYQSELVPGLQFAFGFFKFVLGSHEKTIYFFHSKMFFNVIVSA